MSPRTLPNGLPYYDVKANCGASRHCIVAEQDAYDRLQYYWADLPTRTKAYCEQMAHQSTTLPPMYTMLDDCASMVGPTHQYQDRLKAGEPFHY